MKGWDKISLFKFQQIEIINAKDIEVMDRLLFTTCLVFGYTEYELDNLPIKKVGKMVNKVEAIFNSELNPVPVGRIGKYFLEYDPGKLTFGQYVELSFFFQMPIITAAHYVLASITHTPFQKNKAANHKLKADYFLSTPIEKVIGSVKKFNENFVSFNNEYKGLFGLADESGGKEVQEDKFNKRYGWTYSASCVAEYERITLDQAYSLPVRQALNDLIYLKEKARYDEIQIKKNGR